MKELNKYNKIQNGFFDVVCARLNGVEWGWTWGWMACHEDSEGKWLAVPLARLYCGSGAPGSATRPLGHSTLRRDPKTAGERGLAILSKIFEEVSSLQFANGLGGLRAKFEVDIRVRSCVFHGHPYAIPACILSLMAQERNAKVFIHFTAAEWQQLLSSS